MKKIYNTLNKDESEQLIYDVKDLINKGDIVEVKNIRKTRTNQQNAARWLWLSMISDELNSQGQTFEINGFKIEVPFTKDLLYETYWQTLRSYLFPNKKGQLNTSEFSKLVDTAQMMFAKIFSITIPFPNWQDKMHKEDFNI